MASGSPGITVRQGAMLVDRRERPRTVVPGDLLKTSLISGGDDGAGNGGSAQDRTLNRVAGRRHGSSQRPTAGAVSSAWLGTPPATERRSAPSLDACEMSTTWQHPFSAENIGPHSVTDASIIPHCKHSWEFTGHKNRAT